MNRENTENNNLRVRKKEEKKMFELSQFIFDFCNTNYFFGFTTFRDTIFKY